MNHANEVLNSWYLVMSCGGLGVVNRIREFYFHNLSEIIEDQLAYFEAFVSDPSYTLVVHGKVTRIVNSKVRTPRITNDFVPLGLEFCAAGSSSRTKTTPLPFMAPTAYEAIWTTAART